MYRICKSFRFEAAHQLERAFSKACVKSIHGHSYKVELFLTSRCLDPDLMVVDFGVLADFIDAIKSVWDHALILPRKLFAEFGEMPSNKTVVLEASPTAEVMASILLEGLVETVSKIPASNRLRVEKVRVHETETGWAECVLELEEE